jgi:hypothetical protein
LPSRLACSNLARQVNDLLAKRILAFSGLAKQANDLLAN